MAAVAVVVVVALAATGIGVFLVTQGDDSAGSTTTVDPPGTTGATTSGGGATTAPGSTSTTGPTTGSSGPADTTAGGGFPFSGLGEPLPEAFPVPDGTRDGAIGLEVDAPSSEVVDFYRSALPDAGFTAGEGEPVVGGESLPVEGDGVTGRLLITDVGGPTTIVWIVE